MKTVFVADLYKIIEVDPDIYYCVSNTEYGFTIYATVKVTVSNIRLIPFEKESDVAKAIIADFNNWFKIT